MEGLTRADLAAHLGISPATVRKWQTVFSAHLVTPPGIKGMSTPLIIDPVDVKTLTAVAELRRAGYTLDETAERLPHYLETTPALMLPELQPLEGAATGVSPALYVDSLRALEAAEATAAAIREERDYLRERVEELERRLIEEATARAVAEERARSASGRTPTVWERITGRGRAAE